jgi:hypothetical protein
MSTAPSLGAQADPVDAAEPWPAPRQLHQVGEVARATPEVVDCRRITGEDCYVMTAHVRSVEALRGGDRPFRRLRADDHLDRPILARTATRAPDGRGDRLTGAWSGKPRVRLGPYGDASAKAHGSIKLGVDGDMKPWMVPKLAD